MNKVTKEIAALLNISLEQAVLVQNQMMCNDVDFSACSARVFKREVNQAAKEINII